MKLVIEDLAPSDSVQAWALCAVSRGSICLMYCLSLLDRDPRSDSDSLQFVTSRRMSGLISAVWQTVLVGLHVVGLWWREGGV